jgi:hypothetical protein
VVLGAVAVQEPPAVMQQVRLALRGKAILAVKVYSRKVAVAAAAPEQLAVQDHHTVAPVAPDYLVL